MSIVDIASLKGPMGIRGPQGPQGLPGAEGVPTDEAVSQLVQIPSRTKSAVESALARVASVRVTHEYLSGTFDGQAVQYGLTRASSGGFAPGVVTKIFAEDYEEQWSGGTFAPPKEAVEAVARRVGGTVIANASGWNTTTGEMRGAQIKDGAIYHDLSSGHWQDYAAIGIRVDGTLKTYTVFDGDSAASMVADGVVDSWSWGPPLIRDSGVYAAWDDPDWSSAWPAFDMLSARQILGQDASGAILLITVPGVSGSSGLTMQGAAQLALSHGCVEALALDAGGSTQTYYAGVVSRASSDASGSRPVPDFVVLGGAPVSQVDTGWVPLDLMPGFEAVPGGTWEAPAVRRIGSVVYTRGGFRGLGFSPNTSHIAATIPQGFRPPVTVNTAMGSSDGRSTAKSIANAGGQLIIRTGEVIGDYLWFGGGLSWPVD